MEKQTSGFGQGFDVDGLIIVTYLLLYRVFSIYAAFGYFNQKICIY